MDRGKKKKATTTKKKTTHISIDDNQSSEYTTLKRPGLGKQVICTLTSAGVIVVERIHISKCVHSITTI